MDLSQVAFAGSANCGFWADTGALLVIRKRIGAVLISMRHADLTANEGMVGDLKDWLVA